MRERERERECMHTSRGQAEREGERTPWASCVEFQKFQALEPEPEPDAGLKLTNCDIMTRTEIKSRTLHRLSHQDAPKKKLLIWDNIRNNIYISTTDAWYRIPKTLVISQVTRALGASFVLMWWPLDGSWMASGHQKDQAMIRNLELSTTHPPSPERIERLEVGLMVHYGCVIKLP